MVEEVNKRVPELATLTVRPGIAHGGWDDVYRGAVKNGAKNIWEWMYSFDRSDPGFPKPAASLSTLTTSTTSTITTLSTPVINVNIYGGTNPYNNTSWNNWNVASSLSSGTLKYSDAYTSSVSASLSSSSGINDNGTTYGSGMAPPEVLRYASNATTSRTLTISGLSTSKIYSLDLYGSRNNYSGNQTVFTIAGVSQTISTYKNLTAKAAFTNLTPNTSGQIIVTIKNNQSYNYINGFTIREGEGTNTGNSTTPPPIQPPNTNYTLGASGTQIYYPNGFGIPGLKGGDTINIPAGTYSLISLGNFKGDATNPIVIRNRDGLVITTEIRILNDAKYFKLLGNGKAGITYGFKVSRTQYSGITVSKASDFEIAYCEVTGMTSGFFIKNNPVSTDPSTVYPNYVFKNIYIHHNYVHDIKNEGMYIGHTDPDGGQGGNPLVPVRMENVEIAYNIVERTGWDGIQLANARTGNKIHHNTITNFGTFNISGQQAGIQVGSNSNVTIYDNTIKTGTGNGIQVFGYGYMEIYNNLLENCAKDGSLKGRETIYCSPYISGTEVNPKQQVNIYNNTIRYPQPFGAIRVGGVSGNSLPSTIKDNKLLIPNTPSNWQSIHTFSVIPGSTITGNTLIY